MNVVFDTDVLVAALRSSTGASAELIRLVGDGLCRPVVSVALILEYEAVLTRSEHLQASGLDGNAVETFLDGFLRLAKHTEVHFRYRPVVRDPADELVVEAALNGGAPTIITFNRRDYADGPRSFGIDCLLPREALEKLR